MNRMSSFERIRHPAAVGAWRWRYLRDVVGTLAGVLGPDASRRIARSLARGVFDLSPPIRRTVESHLNEVYGAELGADGCERLARRVFENVALFWAEVLCLRRRLSPGSWQHRVCIHDADTWHSLAGSDRPVILVTTYLGNPVVGACALSCLVPPVHAVVDPVAEWLIERNPQVWRRFRGLRQVPVRQAPAVLPGVLAAGGRVLMIVGRPAATGGVEATILGRRARHSAAVARLAHRHAATIALFACRRRGGTALSFDLSAPVCLRPGDRPPAAADLTQACLDVLEGFVRQDPAQYLWTRR